MTDFIKKTEVYPEWTQFDCPVNQGINSFDMTHHSGSDKTDQEYAKINCKSNFVSSNCRNIFDDGDELQQNAYFTKSIKPRGGNVGLPPWGNAAAPNPISSNFSEYSCDVDEAMTGIYFSHNRGETGTDKEYMNARCCKDMRMQNCAWTPYRKLVESLPDDSTNDESTNNESTNNESTNDNPDSKDPNNKNCKEKSLENSYAHIKCGANQLMQGIRFTHKKNENGTNQRYVSVKCCDVDDTPDETYHDTDSRVYQLHDMHNGIMQSNYDTPVGYNYRRNYFHQKEKNNHNIDDYFYEEMNDSKESYTNINSNGEVCNSTNSSVLSPMRICLIVLLIIILLGVLCYKRRKN